MNIAEETSSPIETDVAIIGAGPAGLFSAFELGLLEVSCHIIDALPRVGGQPVELYAQKPIYDIPGTAVCSGQQLADALMKQLSPFKPPLHLGHRVDSLERQSDGRFLLSTHRGLRLLCKAVFIAAGVGAFEPKRLKLDGLNELENQHLFYRPPEPELLTAQRVVIVGGEDLALEQAIDLATRQDARPARVSLLYRRDGFQAEASTVERFRSLCADGKIDLVVGQAQGFDAPDGQLTALHIQDVEGHTHTLNADKLLVLQGFTPKLGPIADWHLTMERKQIVVDTQKFETNESGVFALGDVNTYPGKRKLILSGFHEGTLAAFAVAEQLSGAPVHLQYTTSSTLLHRLLGLSTS